MVCCSVPVATTIYSNLEERDRNGRFVTSGFCGYVTHSLIAISLTITWVFRKIFNLEERENS